jgi:hypothetical protein
MPDSSKDQYDTLSRAILLWILGLEAIISSYQDMSQKSALLLAYYRIKVKKNSI